MGNCTFFSTSAITLSTTIAAIHTGRLELAFYIAITGTMTLFMHSECNIPTAPYSEQAAYEDSIKETLEEWYYSIANNYGSEEPL